MLFRDSVGHSIEAENASAVSIASCTVVLENLVARYYIFSAISKINTY